jgi:hypothetical protein
MLSWSDFKGASANRAAIRWRLRPLPLEIRNDGKGGDYEDRDQPELPRAVPRSV